MSERINIQISLQDRTQLFNWIRGQSWLGREIHMIGVLPILANAMAPIWLFAKLEVKR